VLLRLLLFNGGGAPHNVPKFMGDGA